MYRKVATIWISLVIVLGTIVIVDITLDFIPTVEGTTRYVNTTGSGGAYTSIQAAINAANPGETVYVYSGEYFEGITIGKKINLLGEDRNTTIINASGLGKDTIKITGSDVNVTGFTITKSSGSSGAAGILLENANNCLITNNNVTDNYRIGVRLRYSDGNNISNNIIYDNYYYGMLLGYSSNNTINENIVSDNNRFGIDIAIDSDDNQVTGNIVDNKDENAISIWESDRNYVIGNTILSSEYGISLSKGDSHIVLDNVIESEQECISIYRSEDNYISNNTMVNAGLDLHGWYLSEWNTHYIDTLNMVNGKPLYYLKNQTSGIVPLGAGQVILANCTNVTIENQILLNGTIGILLGYSSYNNITGNNASFNNQCGILLDSSNYNYISGNIANSNDYDGIVIIDSNNNLIESNIINLHDEHGLMIESAFYNKIKDNTISSNLGPGIALYGAWGSNLTGNTMLRNGIILYGDVLDWTTHSIDTSNTVNGKPVYYWKNQTGGTIPPGAGQVIIANSGNITVQNQNITNSTIGIAIGYSYINNIRWNEVSEHTFYGIYLFESDGNNILFNNISSNPEFGMYLRSSKWNNIKRNEVSNNQYGIHLYDSVENNLLINNLSNNIRGISISQSADNYVYHNNFIDNNKGGSDNQYDNFWNYSYPLGGNYWSDYVGNDFFSGPDQNIAGSDGIGDTNFSFDYKKYDNYPLMAPYMAQAPSAPQSLQVSSGDSYIHLSWASPVYEGDSEILGYYVYRNGSIGVYYSLPATQLWFNDMF
jgi:parallel beta-helix repeat protein